jgi:1-aminocyclopropane-1-carboxylate deaminase/D-cysteine desulfhydrase-like pyridoxal-dependent ACC family enzyme
MSATALTTDELRRRAVGLPRVELAHLPTPLEEAPRFAERVGPVRVFLKRDDCTGLLLGGNKARHNEFILGDALHRGCDVVVWGAGVQSNNCRQTAAACARLGLECRLYLSTGGWPTAVQGNLLLDYLVGAKVEFVDAAIGPPLDALLRAKAEAARAEGRKPFAWDRDRLMPLAAVSYTLALAEAVDDLASLGLTPDAVYVSSASATGAGVTLGAAALGLRCAVRIIAPMGWPWDTRADIAATANKAARLLGLPHELGRDDIDCTDAYIGPAYGVPSPAGQAALRLLAGTEGVLLDPVYSAKAMAALIEDARTGRLAAGATVLFIHTGGQPAVFAYADEMMKP